MRTLTLDLRGLIDKITDEQYEKLCRSNPDLNFELDKQGNLIIVPPTGGWTGNKNIKISQQLANWTDRDGTGIAFDSSTEFNLPEGGKRSPDSAWIKLERWNELTEQQQESFPPICPDFVVELRSKSDNLRPLQDKMQEYLDSGLRLGWLIDPKNRQVEIYRQGQDKQVLEDPKNLSGEDVLWGFVLNLQPIWG